MNMRTITSHALSALLLCFLSGCDTDTRKDVESQGRWQKIVEIHPQDRTKAVQMMITADNPLPAQKDIAALVLSCQKGVTDAYIIWRQYLGAYDLEVFWKSGTSPEVSESWSLSTDSEALFAPEPVAFIKQMMLHDSLLVKTTPFGSEPLTLIFNTEGLDQEIIELRKACNW